MLLSGGVEEGAKSIANLLFHDVKWEGRLNRREPNFTNHTYDALLRPLLASLLPRFPSEEKRMNGPPTILVPGCVGSRQSQTQLNFALRRAGRGRTQRVFVSQNFFGAA